MIATNLNRCVCIPQMALLLALCHTALAQADCYIDPYNGRQICTSPSAGWQSAPRVRPTTPTQPQSPAPSPRATSHCRICVGDGTTGSGTLIEVTGTSGLVLTCSHLFDTSSDAITVSFASGERFVARLIDRDRLHDLAVLAIGKPREAAMAVNDAEPTGVLSACGFGPTGQFRCIVGNIVGRATAVGATYPSLTMSGTVRPGDSGGAVLNAAGELVGVIWGQRDGLTYATCGQPLRNFIDRIRSRQTVAKPRSPAPSPQIDWATWSREIEARIKSLDAKKQDRGHYLQAGDLNGYLRAEDAPQVATDQFAQRTEVESKLKSLSTRFESVTSRIESVRERAEEIAASKVGFFQGLSFGKLAVGALGLSGPLAVAVIVAGGLAGRRIKSRVRGQVSTARGAPALDCRASTLDPAQPIVVDSPIPPQRTVPETHYVPIEKDSFSKAHQWASEHVARKYPGAAEILQAQDSLIKQYIAGQ
jgi:hypothetical protein